MADIPQPWRFMSVYEFDYAAPEIELPALGPLLAEARDAGLNETATESERIFTYAMRSDWVSSANCAISRTRTPFITCVIVLSDPGGAIRATDDRPGSCARHRKAPAPALSRTRYENALSRTRYENGLSRARYGIAAAPCGVEVAALQALAASVVAFVQIRTERRA